MTPTLWHDVPWDVSVQRNHNRIPWWRRIEWPVLLAPVISLLLWVVIIGIALVAWWGISAVWRLL